MRLLFDLEADNFLDKATKVYCLVAKDIDTGLLYLFDDRDEQRIEKGVELLMSAEELIGHNVIGYDLPLLNKLYSARYTGKITDTLLLSRLLNPDRERPLGLPMRVGAHSLEAWGVKLGNHKIHFEDFSQYTPEMLEYCIQDVELTHLVLQALQYEQHGWDWRKSIQIETKVMELIQQQEMNGWRFDKELAIKLVAQLNETIDKIDEELHKELPLTIEEISVVDKVFKKNGSVTERAALYVDRELISGPFTAVEFSRMNLGSEKQVKAYLLTVGWIPTEYNFKKDKKGKPVKDSFGQYIQTGPKLTLDSFDNMVDKSGVKIVERIKLCHRRSQIEGWIENLRDDGRLEARATTAGTNTGRMRHTIIVNVPKATDGVFLGKEMRSLFIADDDKVLVGCDAASLELRILAHYMNDWDFTQTLTEGDIHEYNRVKAGLDTRTQAKSFIYALLYGAGNAKLGSITGVNEEGGKILRDTFLSGIPSLKDLIENVKTTARRRQFLKGIDNRKLVVRSAHSAFNTLIQSAGAIVMKVALCILDRELKKSGLFYRHVGNFHDEYTVECYPQDAEYISKVAEGAIVAAGKYFNLRCPLAAESHIGKTWAMIH